MSWDLKNIKRIILEPKCQIEKRELKILLRKYMYIKDVGSNSTSSKYRNQKSHMYNAKITTSRSLD